MRKPSARPSTDGFTLLELLLVVTLLSLAVATALAALQAGLQSYRHGAARSDLLREVRGGLLFLAADIERAAMVVDPGVHFQETSLSFLALTDAGDGLERITYSFMDGALLRAVEELEATAATLYAGDGGANTGIQPAGALPVLRGIDTLSFEYQVTESWAVEVASQSGLPEALRISLHMGVTDAPGDFVTAYRFPSVKLPEDDGAQDGETEPT